ncbi:MAG TPA: aminoglycoside phosphotransferase family protein [Mycobacteriales bacterium]|jgi:spectinomycin phosphotransferase|nr:aminoglycoside phosphotransferase family protein [Mycobacteriales bacterium]
MRDEPAELPVDAVLGHVRDGWDVPVEVIRYLPVGAGSYNWVAEADGRPAWFIKCDRIESQDTRQRLCSTFLAAAKLRDGGLEFVVAPIPDRSGQLLRVITPGWAMSVCRYLGGSAAGEGDWPDEEQRAEVAALLGRLHAAPVPECAPRWAPPPELVAGPFMPSLDRLWSAGPFSAPAREMLLGATEHIESLIARFRRLLARLEADSQPWVLTHGEPHSANIIRTDAGRMHLIDWDSARIAPREREFRRHLVLDGSALDAYSTTAGTSRIRPYVQELYSVEWNLVEILWFSYCLRIDHADTPDARRALTALDRYLHP